MSWRERLPFKGVPQEEKDRREKIADTLDTIYVFMTLGHGGKMGSYETNTLPVRIQRAAQNGDKIAQGILTEAPDLKSADRVKLAFDNTFADKGLSKREMSFTISTDQNTMFFVYNKDTFKIKNPGQYGLPGNPDTFFANIIGYVAGDLSSRFGIVMRAGIPQ